MNASTASSCEQSEPERASDHVALPITSSLNSALQRVIERHRGKPVVIWADAVCINQFDIPEKNAQLKLMRDIYEHAVNTWIDLGEEHDGSQQIPDLLERLLESVPEKVHDYRDWIGRSTYLPEISLPSPESVWPPINALIRRPW